METLFRMWEIFKSRPSEIIVLVAIMTSALIVFIGAFKPFVFNKIKNKHLRKSLLAFTTIALSFVSTAITFWIRDYNFIYYWYAAGASSVVTIVVYWLYEHTNLRDLIHAIGSKSWVKILSLLQNTAKDKAVDEVEAIKKELLKNKPCENKITDRELENL